MLTRRLLLSLVSCLSMLALVSCTEMTEQMARMSDSADRTPKEEVADARAALADLYRSTPEARKLGDKAAAVLVFPQVYKAGLGVGGQFGHGVLFREGKFAGFYNTSAASYGLQAGAQKFGYALMFMTEADLAYLKSSEGWEVGVGPSVVIVDKGMANSVTTTTTRKGVYAFFFNQEGLMAGAGLQGTKITERS